LKIKLKNLKVRRKILRQI